MRRLRMTQVRRRLSGPVIRPSPDSRCEVNEYYSYNILSKVSSVNATI
ncbi:hypothetical protein HMPREF1868_01965 [Olsenella sp. DNF00959]|nr:hypothetical protein HMPREF1868_01965 [Olsenella sp. DNF00959]